MSCAKTPSWNRRHSQGDHTRRRRHLDRIRFVAAFLTVVFELPLSDVTVVDGEKAVLDCRVTVTPAASRSVRRDAIQRDVLLARPDVERRSGNRGLCHRAARAPVTDMVARRAGQAADDRLHGGQPGRAERLPSPRLRRKRRDLPGRRLSDRFHGRRLTVTVTIRIRPVQSHSLFAPCLQ